MVANWTNIGENAKIGCAATVDEGNSEEGDGDESEGGGDDEL